MKRRGFITSYQQRHFLSLSNEMIDPLTGQPINETIVYSQEQISFMQIAETFKSPHTGIITGVLYKGKEMQALSGETFQFMQFVHLELDKEYDSGEIIKETPKKLIVSLVVKDSWGIRTVVHREIDEGFEVMWEHFKSGKVRALPNVIQALTDNRAVNIWKVATHSGVDFPCEVEYSDYTYDIEYNDPISWLHTYPIQPNPVPNTQPPNTPTFNGEGMHWTVQRMYSISNYPYKWGGDNISEGGFDCSGGVIYSYNYPWRFRTSDIPRIFKRWTGEPRSGMILWKPNHCALYHDGHSVEFESTATGFQVRPYGSKPWQGVFYDPNVQY